MIDHRSPYTFLRDMPRGRPFDGLPQETYVEQRQKEYITPLERNPGTDRVGKLGIAQVESRARRDCGLKRNCE